MTKMTLATARAFANEASRGGLSALGNVLRALINDEVRDIPVPGVGITGGTGTICKWSVHERGDIIVSQCLIDLTGLASSTTDLDVIGQGTVPAYLGQITAAVNGTILGGSMACLELPTTGADDIDLYSAEEGTADFDEGIAALTETAIVTKGGAWAIDNVEMFTGIPGANEYLYLCGGEAGTADTYDAGKFLITLYGYDA